MEVVGDVAVVSGHPPGPGRASRAMMAARCRPTGQPSVRSVTSVACSGVIATRAVGEDLLGRRRRPRARSVARSSTASPVARSRGRCGCSSRLAVTTCEPAGMPDSATRQDVVARRASAARAGRRAEHERDRGAAEHRRDARRAPAEGRHAQPAHRRRRPGVFGHGPLVRRRQQEQHALGSSSSRSRDSQATRRRSLPRPLDQQRRLPVAGGRGDADRDGTRSTGPRR